MIAWLSEVAFVPYEQFVHVLARAPVNLVQPLLYVVERLLVRYVIYNDNTVGTTVVRRSDGTETFLSSRIPKLKFDCLSI